MTRLYVMNGPQRGQSFELKGGIINVGRSSDNDIQIDDDSISRNHFRIHRRGDKFYIEDLESTNRTHLDGEPLNPGAEFEAKEGSPIKIGRTLLSLGEEFSEPVRPTLPPGSETVKVQLEKLVLSAADRPLTYPRTMELIHNVSTVLMGSLNINEILEQVMDYLFDLLRRTDRGTILLINRETGKPEQVCARSKYGGTAAPLNYSRRIVERVIKERKALMIPDLGQENPDSFSDSMKKIRSVMCVPLISKSELRGLIYVDSLDLPHGFRNEDLLLLSSLSSPVAMAIENAHIHSNLEEMIKRRTATLRDTQKKLKESQARFKAIFDNMSNGVVVYDAVNNGENFVVMDLNRAARKIDNTTKKAALRKSVNEIFPGAEDPGLSEVFKRVYKTGKPEQYSMTLHQEDRIAGWREYYVYCLPSGEIVAICEDVTGRKMAEEEQKTLQKQLLVSQKMESIGAFAGGTAHNFRNILQGILGNIEYLEMIYGEAQEIKELSRNIHDSVEKGIDLINNLLQFSRRGEEYELVDLDLSSVLMKTYEVISKVFDKNIELEVNMEKNLFIKGEDSLLSQVFLNLFTNARDAMPGGGKLVIEAKRVGDNIVAIVSDTGHGIDKEIIDKIFDPFFTLKEVGKGTGLGLSTSHGIVKQHEGTITVTSTPGHGASFEISIPSTQPEGFERTKPSKKIKYGKGQKVLIVDDEHVSLRSLSELTRRLGYQTIAVDKPLEAVENYCKWAPDVVLMDRNMPGMDGITCIKKIIKKDPEAKIVIVSGYDESGPDGIDEAVRRTIKGYITKPCGLETLSLELHRILEA